MRDDIRRAWVEALKRETDPGIRQWAQRMLRGEPAPAKHKRRRQRKPAR